MVERVAWRSVAPPLPAQIRRATRPEDMFSPVLAEAFRWYRKRAPDLGPIRRADLDPLTMRPFLENVVLVDVQPPVEQGAPLGQDSPVFRYTLVGAHMDHHRPGLKGLHLHELDLREWRDYWFHAYHWSVGGRVAVTDRTPVGWRDHEYLSLEFLIVPVLDTADRIARTLVVVAFTPTDDEA